MTTNRAALGLRFPAPLVRLPGLTPETQWVETLVLVHGPRVLHITMGFRLELLTLTPIMALTPWLAILAYPLECMLLVKVQTPLSALCMLPMALRLLMTHPFLLLIGWCSVARSMVWLLAPPTRMLAHTVPACLLSPMVPVRPVNSRRALGPTRPPDRLKRRLLVLKDSPLMCLVLLVNYPPRSMFLIRSLLQRPRRVVYLGARAVLMGGPTVTGPYLPY